MDLLEIGVERPDNPVDLVERMASANNWAFERSADDEITISVEGSWSEYHLSFQWMDDIEALHVACAFDLKVPQRRRPEMFELLALVNEQLWIGHFDCWRQEGVIVFRHSLLLAGGAEVESTQCEALLKTAIETCERYYQGFQFLVWAGKSPRQSLEALILETAGEA